MFFAIVSTLLLAAAPEVEVRTLSGDQTRGKLTRLSTDLVEIAAGAEPRTFPAASLLSVKPAVAPASNSAPPAVWIELVDGSHLLAAEFTTSKQVAKVVLSGGESIDIPTRSIHTVRLKEHDAEAASEAQLPRQWRELVEDEIAGDTIIIRKASDDALILDELEGVIGDVTADKVHFKFEDQVVPVDRNKVEGLVYFHPAGRELPEPLCRVDDVAGSRWNAKSISLQAESLQLVSTSGVKVDLPLARFAGLDYSAGKIVYLSDVEPEHVEWSNAFGETAASESLAKLFAPRRDQSFQGGPLTIGGKAVEKGLALHSRTLIEYRLAGKYNKFLATAAMDDKVRPAGDVMLVLALDGKPLGELRISGKDASPTALDYDIRGGRKLSILVDFGAGLDIGDRLHLGSARVTK